MCTRVVKDTKNIHSKPLVSTNDGYILPCCWADNCQKVRTRDFSELTKEHLKIDNVDSIEEIIESNEWIEFFRVLTEEPENAPITCKEKCDSNRPDQLKKEVTKDTKVSYSYKNPRVTE